MKRYRVVHTTEYRFENPVNNCRLNAMLRPLETACQQVDHFQIVTRPYTADHVTENDPFGNTMTRIEIQDAFQRLMISAIGTVAVTDGVCHCTLDQNTDVYKAFKMPTSIVATNDALADYGRAGWNQDLPLAMAAESLNQKIFEDLAFRAGVTDTRTTAEQVLHDRRGVCQDFAHLAIGVLRSMGLPARYVSGYVHTAAFRGKDHRIAADASHAWFEVLDPRSGWVGFDPTNGRRVDGHYIIVARGRDYNDVCPIQGTFEGGSDHRLQVSVDVKQIESVEAPSG